MVKPHDSIDQVERVLDDKGRIRLPDHFLRALGTPRKERGEDPHKVTLTLEAKGKAKRVVVEPAE